MAGAFLWDDRVASSASISALAGTVVSSMPLSNLLDPQPRLRARLLGSTASILVDLGADTAIEAVALISTSLPDTATIRWRLGPAESLVEAVSLFDMRFTDAAGPSYPTGWAFNRGSLGWCIDGTGTMVQVAADTPRFDYDPVTHICRGLLLEESRTNQIRNPRAEGAVGPSTWPTNWNVTNGTGLTVTINGTGSENGFPYIEFRINGTATATANIFINFEPTTQIAAAVSQVWTHSLFAKMQAGSSANIASFLIFVSEFDSTSTNLANSSSTIAFNSAPLGQYRASHTRTLTGATTAYAKPRLQLNVNNGAVVDVTLRLSIPQMEQGGQASSPILPTIGTPAATTRAVDQARVLGLSFAGAFTLLVQGSVSGTGTQVLVPGGGGPNNDFPNSSYFTIDNTGYGAWTALAGGSNFSPGGVTGSIGQANILVAADDGTGSSFARNGTLRTTAVAWTVPSTLDRATLGGAPWGTSTTMGTALGIGVYQRFALYRTRLLDTQVNALSSNGSSLVTAALVHDSNTIAASTGDSANGNVILLRSSAATGRYLQVDVTAPSASFSDLGRLIAGSLWRPAHAHAYGIAEGRLMLDRRDRNALTGAEFPVPAVANPRMAKFTLPLLTSAETRGQHRSMLTTLGAAGDALWIPDIALALSELNVRSLWGAIAASGDEAVAVRDHPATNSRGFRIVERL